MHLRYVHIPLALLPSLMPRIFRELSAHIKALGGNRQGVVFMDIAPRHISSDVVRAASECGWRMVKKNRNANPPTQKKHSPTQNKTTQNKHSGTTWPSHMGSIFPFSVFRFLGISKFLKPQDRTTVQDCNFCHHFRFFSWAPETWASSCFRIILMRASRFGTEAVC